MGLTKSGESDQLYTDLSGVLLPGDNVTVRISNPETIKQVIPARKANESYEAYEKRLNEAGYTLTGKDLEINVPYTGKYADFAASMATALKGTDLQFDPNEIRGVK